MRSCAPPALGGSNAFYDTDIMFNSEGFYVCLMLYSTETILLEVTVACIKRVISGVEAILKVGAQHINIKAGPTTFINT